MARNELGTSLQAAFASVPDPRDGRGLRHPLPAILTWVTAAMLSGATSLSAMVQWGHLQEPAVVRALGFRRERTPAIGTLHNLLGRLDADAVDEALAKWQQAQFSRPGQAIALDGKALKGSHRGKAPKGGWIDVIAAYTHETGQVLAQLGGQDHGSRRGVDGRDPPVDESPGRTADLHR